MWITSRSDFIASLLPAGYNHALAAYIFFASKASYKPAEDQMGLL